MRIYQVDAFTSEPFKGNPAGVCLLEGERPDGWMQAVAAEMNLSETAFVRREGDHFALRWFTPGAEVDLCGHATLASAHVLWEEGVVPHGEPLRFATRSGILGASASGDLVELDFPARPAAAGPLPGGVLAALGAEPDWTGEAAGNWVALLASEDEVRGLAPDLGALRRLPGQGLLVTAAAEGAGADFVSRYFAPAVAVDEDPVTGSAHCTLAPFWSERLGKREMVGYQASRRGGTVRVRLEGDRVVLGGHAVTVLRGQLC